MEKDLFSVIELMDFLINTVDPDGVCENGCYCGECDGCIDYNDTVHDFNLIKEKYSHKEQ